MKNDRLFQTLYLLMEKGTLTAPELARALDVSVRTVYRDVEALSQAGVPVYAEAGKGGGISLMPGFALNRALLSEREQEQILFAIQSLQAFDQPMGALLSKLGAVFQKRGANWIEVDFSRWGCGVTDRERFETLKDAILDRRILLIRYCGAYGGVTERRVKPFRLVFKDKSWYLRAYCLKAEDYRLFKLSRIVTLCPQDECFRECFDDAPPLEMNPGPVPPLSSVKLRFRPAAAFRVMDEFDPSDVTREADGSLTVAARFPLDDWIIGYLLTYGTDVTILDPPDIRARIYEAAENIAAHHKT